MKIALPSRMLALLLGVLAAAHVAAQETEQAAPPPPAFEELASDWWTYFQGSREEVEPRVEAFLRSVSEDIAPDVVRRTGFRYLIQALIEFLGHLEHPIEAKFGLR